MTAQYPDAIYTPRTMVNRTGVTYEAERTKDIYAEDFNKDRAEIVAVETELGTDPKGASADVSARLDAIESAISAKPDFLDIFPVGHIYISVNSTSPATLFGGTWAVFGAGRTLVSLNSADTDFDTVEETRGAKTVTLTSAESGLPAHHHGVYFLGNSSPDGSLRETVAGSGSTTSTTDNAAANAVSAHNNIQPSIVVYMWKRTS